jgi:outer membrane protein, multidrug efflux system
MSTLSLVLFVASRTLTLDEAIALAEERSVEVEVSQIDQDRARLRTLRANLERVHATVDASVAELYDKPNLFGPTPPGSPDILLGLSSLEARVGVPIFSGFRVEANIARAELLERATVEETERERRDLALAVARAYWSVRRLALLEEAQRASTERLAESERLVKARVDAGLAAGLDINRAAARGARLDVERTALANERREATVRLAMLLGMPDEELELVDGAPARPAADGSVDSYVQQAFDARPELRALELQNAALVEEQRAVESNYWPQLDGGVLMQLGNNPALAGVGSRAVIGAANPFANVVGDVQVGLTLRMNLFDTFATTHAVDDVGHRRRRAALERTGVARSVESEVRIAHARVTSLVAQRAALVKAKEMVGDNLVILEKAYGRGEVLFTEVLDVQVELADAERQIVDVDAQLALATLELQSAVGSAVGRSES